MTKCRYCGFEAVRATDEDCPALVAARTVRRLWAYVGALVITLSAYVCVVAPMPMPASCDILSRFVIILWLGLLCWQVLRLIEATYERRACGWVDYGNQ